ncbi:hypothetical protein BU23DRAFT_535202 [Bimuria novae-zelandiae CBS 107.79]|uniref:Amino acid permease/ SLC12A domain-containing protein n=1 Tax=Bimuria novae-zelandiae CBS 107.79 TaxID=1447943 RepID=A0A6A5V882_9PLEO|nr:hypothetical protein BU23DRAFT_535202 [Bimuria novae-zelandiae CBS 107.79]
MENENEKSVNVAAESVELYPIETVADRVYDGQLDNVDGLQRHLGNRQLQLIAIGGSIGTATFVSISVGLLKGGPGSLLLAYTIYTCMLSLVNNCQAEMSSYMPVTGGFVRMSGKWVDEALGFMVGWNFFLYEAILVPFEITALNLVLSYWRDDIPDEAVVAGCIVLYFCINAFAVTWYGECEFWFAFGKVFLLTMLFSFTFITMVGGNPKHDAYGFRYWKHPGPFADHAVDGPLGRFEGFLAALWNAAFTVVGPEYVSMVAGEARRPRKYMKAAFKATYARLGLFFIGSALCVGIVIPHDETTLIKILLGSADGAGTAAASPYVIAMKNLGIEGLPHITNALLVSSIFSAGNAYTYYGTRCLYGLAIENQAPCFLRKCTKTGVPINCLCVVMLFPFLAFLNASKGPRKVFIWLTNIITGAQVINYIVICINFIFFYRACKTQGLDRRTLPYSGRFQPWSAYIPLVFLTCVAMCYGYTVFLPGYFSTEAFLTFYMMLLVDLVLFVGWKLWKKTKFVKASEADLIWDKPIIDAYENGLMGEHIGFWRDLGNMFGKGFMRSEKVDKEK